MKLAFATNRTVYETVTKLKELKDDPMVRPLTAVNYFCRFHCPHTVNKTALEAFECHHDGCPFGILKGKLTQLQEERALNGAVSLKMYDPYEEYPQEDFDDSDAVETQNSGIVDKLKDIFSK